MAYGLQSRRIARLLFPVILHALAGALHHIHTCWKLVLVQFGTGGGEHEAPRGVVEANRHAVGQGWIGVLGDRLDGIGNIWGEGQRGTLYHVEHLIGGLVGLLLILGGAHLGLLGAVGGAVEIYIVAARGEVGEDEDTVGVVIHLLRLEHLAVVVLQSNGGSDEG